MAQNNKVYGWVITIVETPNTIPTLFDSILQWRDNVTAANTAYSRFSEQTKLVDWEKQGELWDFFMSNTTRDRSGDYAQKEEYNMCHFWTNFEIGDLRFFRSKEYRALFDHLDRAGGFYTERVREVRTRVILEHRAEPTLDLFAVGRRAHQESCARSARRFRPRTLVSADSRSSDVNSLNCHCPSFEDISYQHDWFVHVPQTEGVGCNCKEPPWGEWVRPIGALRRSPSSPPWAKLRRCPAADKDPWYSCLPRWNALDSPEH